ncbi:unnamed protein product [Coffea canephora]|uniref:Uncharacterized protein n=1 Tax=Coffea canephora TaxID=49390 RepID=A0A068V7V4_COFCA|nr:unnamed protein product [Coffea canephora]
MSPVTRRAWKTFQRRRGLSTCSSKLAQGENDLQFCLTNYFKVNYFEDPILNWVL